MISLDKLETAENILLITPKDPIISSPKVGLNNGNSIALCAKLEKKVILILLCKFDIDFGIEFVSLNSKIPRLYWFNIKANFTNTDISKKIITLYKDFCKYNINQEEI